MKLALLFALTSVLGGAGRLLGIVTLGGLATGAALAGGVLGGFLFMIGAAILAQRLALIRPHQRTWTIVGGLLGVATASLVTIITMSATVGLYMAAPIMGMGATMGSLIGKSAHERADAT